MTVRTSFMICLLALGCTDQPGANEADGGNTIAPIAKNELVAPGAAAKAWPTRRRPGAEIGARDSGLTLVPRLGPDGGLILPEPREEPQEPKAPPVDGGTIPDEEDAGSEEPAPCGSSACLCGRLCERGLALACPFDETLEVCVEQCDVASSDCYEQLLRMLTCKVALPDAAYSCDPDFLAFVVEGCTAEEVALQTCRSF